MTFDHEKWRNILAGLQSLAVATAVIVGGAWSLYTFDVLGARDRAAAELERIQQDIDQQATVQVDIDAEQVALPAAGVSDDPGRYIVARVSVKNTGNRDTVFDFSKRPLGVARVLNPGQGPVPTVGPRSRYGVPIVPVLGWPGPPDGEPSAYGEVNNRGIYRGETWHQEFLVKVSGPGVYLVTFAAEVIGAEATKRVALQPDGLSRDFPFVWSATTFVFVE